MKAQAAIATGATWRDALDEIQTHVPMLHDGTNVDLVLLFASDAFADYYDELLPEVRRLAGGATVIGCSGQGIIGTTREIEDRPAISLQAFSLPGAVMEAARIPAAEDPGEDAPAEWLQRVRAAGDVDALMLFVDPFSIDGDQLLARLGEASGGLPLIGGLASGSMNRGGTFLFLDGQAYDDGAVGLAIGGAYTVRTIVSQGAEPIGRSWTITGVRGNVIETIGMRPALEVLAETFHELSPEVQERARSNLLIGLAMDEYRDEFRRGDFLIRNLVGIDQQSGAIAIGALPREGQTLQFQIRDPAAADEDLRQLLGRARTELGGIEPVGALLCSCNGRGIGLFGTPDHDARSLDEMLGPIPVAGFFCNGEIGPVGGRNFLHGFTASIGLILPKDGG